MKKIPRKFSVLIIPERDSNIRRFECTKRLITTVLGIFTAVIVAVGFTVLALGHYYSAYSNTETARLQAAEFERQRTVLLSKINELEDVVMRTQRFAAKIQAVSDGEESAKTGYGPLEDQFESISSKGIWRSPSSRPAIDELAGKMDLMKDASSELEEILHGVFAEQQDRMYFWASLPTAWPTRGFLTSRFGASRGRRMHEGIDLAGPTGTPIVAPGDGIVTFVGYKGGYGNSLKIDHGYGVTTLYAHCSMINVKEGDRVKRGSVVAAVGNTGSSTGPHLHYEVHLDGVPVNPMRYLAKR
jgi:murein DD-endopeptidase MepM/ murein hydrolase activator NlpD